MGLMDDKVKELIKKNSDILQGKSEEFIVGFLFGYEVSMKDFQALRNKKGSKKRIKRK